MFYDQVDMIVKLAGIHDKLLNAEMANARGDVSAIVDYLTSIFSTCHCIIEDLNADLKES